MTGPEIVRQLGQLPDYVVAASARRHCHGRCLLPARAGRPTRVYAVEPAESPLISQALAGAAPAGASRHPGDRRELILNADLSVPTGLAVSTDEAIRAGARRRAGGPLGGHLVRREHGRGAPPGAGAS
ncbi:MAG: hypothetical protein ACLSVD_11240 [Eggerthellaceae bacterium]